MKNNIYIEFKAILNISKQSYELQNIIKLCINWTTGVLAPTLIQLEEEIDRELAEDSESVNNKADDINEDICEKQIITNDLKSLHERVN